jgi:hypothetical protein
LDEKLKNREERVKMKTGDTTDSKKAYDNARFDIDSLMNLLEMELAKPQDNPTWGQAGTMRHAREELIELVSHLTGRSIATLREALDEIRQDAELLSKGAGQ